MLAVVPAAPASQRTRASRVRADVFPPHTLCLPLPAAPKAHAAPQRTSCISHHHNPPLAPAIVIPRPCFSPPVPAHPPARPPRRTTDLSSLQHQWPPRCRPPRAPPLSSMTRTYWGQWRRRLQMQGGRAGGTRAYRCIASSSVRSQEPGICTGCKRTARRPAPPLPPCWCLRPERHPQDTCPHTRVWPESALNDWRPQ